MRGKSRAARPEHIPSNDVLYLTLPILGAQATDSETLEGSSFDECIFTPAFLKMLRALGVDEETK